MSGPMLARLPPTWTDAWSRLSARERRLALAAAAVLVIATAWAGLWQPMGEDTARLRRELPRDRVALATARAHMEEISGMHRAPPERSGGIATDPRLAIERVLTERALRASLTSLDVKDNRAYVTFAAIQFDALVGVLDAVAKSDGLRPVEATLTSRVDPGSVRAEITLAR